MGRRVKNREWREGERRRRKRRRRKGGKEGERGDEEMGEHVMDRWGREGEGAGQSRPKGQGTLGQ